MKGLQVRAKCCNTSTVKTLEKNNTQNNFRNHPILNVGKADHTLLNDKFLVFYRILSSPGIFQPQ